MSTNPFNIQQPQHLIERKLQMEMCQDFYSGADKVMNEKYLAKFNIEKNEKDAHSLYKRRIASTPFNNIVSPLIEAIVGLTLKYPPDISKMKKTFQDMQNVDGADNSYFSFVKDALTNSLINGLVFMAVETNDSRDGYNLKTYPYDSLVSYRRDGNKISALLFKEDVHIPDGAYSTKKETRIKVFKPNGGEIWSAGKKLGDWENSLEELPVCALITGRQIGMLDVVSTFYDIAVMSRVLLNRESQLAFAIALGCIPMLQIFGGGPQEQIEVGVYTAINFTDKITQGLAYAEIEGKTLTIAQKEIGNMKTDVQERSLGILKHTNSKTVVEAADVQAKNTAYLSAVSNELDIKFNFLNEIIAKFTGNTPEKVTFKRSFDDVIHTEKQIEMLEKMVAQGELTLKTFYLRLIDIGFLPRTFNAAEEIAELKNETYTIEDEDPE